MEKDERATVAAQIPNNSVPGAIGLASVDERGEALRASCLTRSGRHGQDCSSLQPGSMYMPIKGDPRSACFRLQTRYVGNELRTARKAANDTIQLERTPTPIYVHVIQIGRAHV